MSSPDKGGRRWRRRLLIAAALIGLGLCLVLGWHAWTTRGLTRHELLSQGRRRVYYVHLPPAHSRTRAVPLVIALHGNGGTAARLNHGTRYGLTRQADARGWVLVIPQGISESWNDHRPFKEQALQGVDDVGFLTQLIDRAHADYGIDTDRVFIVGASNGGAMALTFAVEASERVRAVAAVVMGLPAIHEHHPPKRPVSVLMINGERDPIVPYAGGDILGKRGRVLSSPASLDWWATHDGCAQTRPEIQLPDLDPTDGTRVFVERREDCTDGASVELYRVEGGGHTWPGGRPYAPQRIVGRTSHDIDASQVAFAFFASHSAR